MRRPRLLAALSTTALAIAAVFGLAALRQAPVATASSPDGRTVFVVSQRDGTVKWSVRRDGDPLVLPSGLGFKFRNAPDLGDSLKIVAQSRVERDTTFSLPWGEVSRVRDRHTELRVDLEETSRLQRKLTLVVRVFDDGIGFRYELPEQPNLGEFVIAEELTDFTFAEDMKAWWAPADVPSPDRQEMLYSSGPLSKLRLVHTPLTLVGTNGVHVVVHEAELVNYAGMYLRGDHEYRTLRVQLAKMADGSAVSGTTNFKTPWRTLQIADNAAGLVPSVLGLKLNAPSRISDVSHTTPTKYNGIWWGMHVNTMAWRTDDPDGVPHGATTANAKAYIDFASANGLGGTLIEGWNVGWNGDWMKGGGEFNFSQAYPDYDLPAVAAYAREKGVQLIMHNETATFIDNYERQLDSAFALYQRLGIRTIKTGYVNDVVQPQGHDHQSQFMVNHHRRVLETAQRYGLSIVMHEPIKDTGERRTFPNMLSREGSRGQEFNAWGRDGGNPPEHETILFFTRMLAGPMDFTPGIFNLTITRSKTNQPRRLEEARPRTTLAKQLALYVVLYSPVQMAADLIENYADQPAFQFIRDVPTDWDTTVVLGGEIGEYVVVARKAKGKDEWYIGAITDERARPDLSFPLDFLSPNVTYRAEIYADAANADWRTNPTAIAPVSTRPLSRSNRLRMNLAPGGGQAIRIVPAAP